MRGPASSYGCTESRAKWQPNSRFLFALARTIEIQIHAIGNEGKKLERARALAGVDKRYSTT